MSIIDRLIIDFSPYSRYVISIAEIWSKCLNAQVLLVHKPVIPLPGKTGIEDENRITGFQINEATELLKIFAEEHMQDTSMVSYIVRPDPLIETIKKLIKEPYYNLLIAGLKGGGFLKKVFIGSTVVQIVDALDTPILTVPKNPVTILPSELYVGTYYKFPLNTRELDMLLVLLGGKVKSIKFISMAASQRETSLSTNYLNGLKEKYNEKFNVHYEIHSGQKAFYEIKQYMLERNNGIFVAQRGGRSLTDMIFRKFLINELIYDGSIPLMILP